MTLNQLLNRCDSKLEKYLIRALYPAISECDRKELVAQHLIEESAQITVPDFAFPNLRIAIYCDGYYWHKNINSFEKDRRQSNELQLRDWIVLRFAEQQILTDPDGVILEIQEAIKKVNHTPLEKFQHTRVINRLDRPAATVEGREEEIRVDEHYTNHQSIPKERRNYDKRRSREARRKYAAMRTKPTPTHNHN